MQKVNPGGTPTQITVMGSKSATIRYMQMSSMKFCKSCENDFCFKYVKAAVRFEGPDNEMRAEMLQLIGQLGPAVAQVRGGSLLHAVKDLLHDRNQSVRSAAATAVHERFAVRIPSDYPLKLAHPDQVFLLRGNHEVRSDR